MRLRARAGREHDQGPLGGAGIETFFGGKERGLGQRGRKKNAVLVSAPVSRSIVD